tara:strand:- start:535 stop:1305 length:771 start_codon:yes stop_codon:yes gene_type:complete
MKRIFESSGIKLRLLMLLNFIATVSYLSYFGISTVNVLTVLVMYFLFMAVGMVSTFHRFYSHKSFEFRNKFLEYFCTSLGLLSGSGSVFGWCAVHNKHHDKHDTPEDPHDPSRGLLSLLTLNYNYNIELKYVKYLFKNKFLMFTHKYYYLLIASFVLSLYSLFGIQGIVFGFCMPSFLSVVAQGMTTYFLHSDGNPQCVRWINVLVFGDGNHDEHHLDTKKYKLKYDDVSGWIIENLLISNSINIADAVKRNYKWQ